MNNYTSQTTYFYTATLFLTLLFASLTFAQPSKPTLALLEDTGTDTSDKRTNNSAITISDLTDSNTWSFSTDSGSNWIMGEQVGSSGTATFNPAFVFSGSFDDDISPLLSTTSAGTFGGINAIASGQGIDELLNNVFFFDITMPSSLSNDKEALFEIGGNSSGLVIFTENGSLKTTIASGRDESDFTVADILEAGKSYWVVMEMRGTDGDSTNNTLSYFVGEKQENAPIRFTAFNTDYQPWTGADWTGTDAGGWGMINGAAQGPSGVSYASFSGTFNEGRFYSNQTFAALWKTAGTSSESFIFRQSNNNNTSHSQASAALSLTRDNMDPTISSLATATAIDENSGSNQQIYLIESDETAIYSLGTDNDGSHFTVVPSTGAVTLMDDPDYETKSSYRFTVTASDAAGNTSAAQTVTLAINDLNDNAPVFTSGATAIIAEGETATGYTASATDADAGTTIIYSITGGVDHSLFTLTGGVLSFSAAPDYEAPGDDDSNNDYEVVISASDGAHGTPQTVTVTVTDVDDVAPQLLDTPEGNHNEGVATIRLTLSEDVSLSGESIADDFTITGAALNPVVSSLSVSGSEVTLTLSGVVVQGETVYLSYTKSVNAGSIVDASGNRLGDFSGQEVNFVTFDLNEPKETEIFFTNPVRDRLEIRSESVVKRVALYSLTGRKVLDQRPNGQAPSIDISSLAQAIYLMSVETETNQIIVKLVKQ